MGCDLVTMNFTKVSNLNKNLVSYRNCEEFLLSPCVLIFFKCDTLYQRMSYRIRISANEQRLIKYYIDRVSNSSKLSASVPISFALTTKYFGEAQPRLESLND